MTLRPPAPPLTAHARPARCELVLDELLRRGPIIDAARLREFWNGDLQCIRYSRDVLNMFSQLGVLQHVRRDLWIDRLSPLDPRFELALLATASRALGPWTVAAGSWALRLRGIRLRHVDPDSSVRFALTPCRARPTTYTTRPDSLAGTLPVHANERRHATLILDQAVAAVQRPAHRLGTGSWVGDDELGGHVLDIEHAFISMLEHPRLSGGYAAARLAVLPVLGHVGLDALLAAGSHHPTLAVRRRLAFTLFHAVTRTSEGVPWLGAASRDRFDDEHERWRIVRTLDVLRERGRPTVLEPHRVPVGDLDRRLAVIDNRRAPMLPWRRPAPDRT